jgi:hypothetical protein
VKLINELITKYPEIPDIYFPPVVLYASGIFRISLAYDPVSFISIISVAAGESELSAVEFGSFAFGDSACNFE